MNCKKCGLPLKTGDVFCGNCGTKVEQVATPVAQPVQPAQQPVAGQAPVQQVVTEPNGGNKGLGITSMILGICSIVFSWSGVLFLVLPIVGLILASKAKGNKFAKIGKITSIVGLILIVVSTIAWFAFMTLAQRASQIFPNYYS